MSNSSSRSLQWRLFSLCCSLLTAHRSGKEQVAQLCGVSRCRARDGNAMTDVAFAESAFEARRPLRAVLGMNLFSLFKEKRLHPKVSDSKPLRTKRFFI